MFEVWALPPVALLIGSGVVSLQLRRIAAEGRALAEVVTTIEPTRAALRHVVVAADHAHATLDELDPR